MIERERRDEDDSAAVREEGECSRANSDTKSAAATDAHSRISAFQAAPIENAPIENAHGGWW